MPFFRKKKIAPSVSPADKDWIEENLLWLLEIYGVDRLIDKPFISPSDYTLSASKDALNLQANVEDLAHKICWIIGLDHSLIQIAIAEEIGPKGNNYYVYGTFPMVLSLAYPKPGGDQVYRIHLDERFTQGHDLLIKVLVRKIAEVKFIVNGHLKPDHVHLELICDLAGIYWGFGLYFLNTVQYRTGYSTISSGILPIQMASYACAIICYIGGKDFNEFLPDINKTARDLFKQDSIFLNEASIPAFSEKGIHLIRLRNEVYGIMEDGFQKKEFLKIVQSSEQLLKVDPSNTFILNNYGYALIQLKEYERAILAFDQAIEADPHWDFPINNRGYAKLQSGDLEGAKIDLFQSYKMNPENSYSLRNLGVLWLFNEDYPAALELFSKAIKVDPDTDLINFYLATTYQKLGNEQEARAYFQVSAEKGEHNDSILS